MRQLSADTITYQGPGKPTQSHSSTAVAGETVKVEIDADVRYSGAGLMAEPKVAEQQIKSENVNIEISDADTSKPGASRQQNETPRSGSGKEMNKKKPSFWSESMIDYFS